MIEEQAIVIKASKKLVTLEVVRSKPCGLCGQVRGCGNSIWGKIFSHQSGQIETRNNLNAKLGDMVILGIDETLILKGSLMLYGVPLLTMFIGMLIAGYISQATSEFYVFMGAMIGLCLGVFLIKRVVNEKMQMFYNKAQLIRFK
ncbi:MAG: Fis family transcriptional regulator [Candidatus Methylopumilus sp.]|nr:Fis family transcriptional regulator [Candidatus Methylopumilus sp.]